MKKYPEGYFLNQWVGIGIALGGGIGVPLGIAIGNPAFFGIGIPIGLAIGSAIGHAKEQQAKKEGTLRPLTAEEQKRKQLSLYIGTLGIILGMILLLVVFMAR